MGHLTIIEHLIIDQALPAGRHLLDKGHPSADVHQVVRELGDDESEYDAWDAQRSLHARVIEIASDGTGSVLV